MLYESENDKENEAEIIQMICNKWGVACRKLPIRYIVDYALFRDKQLSAFAEVKRRKNDSTKYPTLIISLFKLINASMLFRRADVPFLLVVGWNDRIGWWMMPNDFQFDSVEWGGRNDRGDSQDMEPVVHIPIRKFKTLGEANESAG